MASGSSYSRAFNYVPSVKNTKAQNTGSMLYNDHKCVKVTILRNCVCAVQDGGHAFIRVQINGVSEWKHSGQSE